MHQGFSNVQHILPHSFLEQESNKAMNNKLQLCTEMESLDEEIKTFSFGM